MVVSTILRRYAKDLRRSGRAQPLTGALQAGWNFWKNTNDYVNSGRVLASFDAKVSGKELPEVVNIVLTDFNGVLAPIQNPKELTRWLDRVAAVKPKVVVEIGTAKGGTFILMARVAAPDATLVSIDMPGGFYGGGYPSWKEGLFRKLIGEGKTPHFIRANSHLETTRARLERILDGRTIDVLFIDGDHTYAGAKRDFDLYSPLMSPGGLIALHDILPNRFDPDINVSRLWEEIKARYPTEEIVDRPDQGNLGIGVVEAQPLAA